MGAKRYGDFRSGEVVAMERRRYTPAGLTAASMQKTSRDRNCSVTLLCKSQSAVTRHRTWLLPIRPPAHAAVSESDNR